MNRPYSHWLRLCFCLFALTGAAALFVGGAHAQSPAASPEASEKLEEVVVTASRRTENLQTSSVSASVLTAEAIEDKGVVNLYALQYAAPAVTISGFGSANVFNIRGIGRSQVDIDVPSGVVIYRDGAPTLAGYFQNEPFFDMDSIQVFRGPQGTFVGKSAAGGAVFINSKDPELGKIGGNVELNVGDFNTKEFTGVLNVPAGETFAFRFGFKHYERDNFYKAITGNFTGHPGDVDNNSYRLGVLWKPNDNFSGVLKADYEDLDFGGNPTSVYGQDPLGNLVQNAHFAYTDKSLRTVLDLKYKSDGGLTLSSLSAYQDIDSVNNLDLNATLPAYYEFNSKVKFKIYSQEFNLVSRDDQRMRWVLGAFWEKQESEFPSWDKGGFNFIGNGFPPTYPWATTPWQKTEDEYAFFAHTGFKFTDSLELEAGTRYSHYKMDQATYWILNFSGTPPDPSDPNSIPWSGNVGGDKQSLTEGTIDGHIALNWTVTGQHFLYGLVSRGHITGGVNLFPAFLPYHEMQVINFEAGWKASWFDKRVRTQFTAYYEDFDNYQANFAEFSVAGINNPTNRNAETTSHISGVELSSQARLGHFSMDLGVAYLDSKLGTFSDVYDPFRVPNCPTPPSSCAIVNLSGAHSPFSPEFTGNLGLAYDIPLGTGFLLIPRVDVSSISKTQAALWDSPMVTLDARTLINGLLTLEPVSKKWSAQFWITNAADKHYIAGIQNNATLYYAAPPRQLGVRLQYNF
jgi:iron complex outermembrane receptor protein